MSLIFNDIKLTVKVRKWQQIGKEEEEEKKTIQVGIQKRG